MNTFLGRSNLYVCSEISPTNLSHNENIIFSFYREKYMFWMYICHVIKHIKTQSLEESIECLTNYM